MRRWSRIACASREGGFREAASFREAAGFPEASPAAGGYRRIFLPWSARPGRDEAWRTAVQAEMFAQRGTHDDFYAEYPGTAEEALAAEQLDRRLPWE